MARAAAMGATAVAAAAFIAGRAAPEAAAVPPSPADRLDELRRLDAEDAAALRANARSVRPLVRTALGKEKDPAARALAARIYLRLDGGAAAAEVLAAMAAERDPDGERGLAQAWSAASDDAARRALADAAADPRDERRAALAAEALGALPGGSGLDDLLAVVGGPCPWPAASGACLALGAIRERRALEALVARVRHPDPCVRASARESLVRLTGEDLGTDPGAWERWWDGAGEGFEFPDLAKAPPRPAAPEDPSRRTTDRRADGRPTHARFFGLELRGPRVAFVIDSSQSMWGPRRERAEAELVAAVKGLPTSATFAVILFNERVWWFRDAPLPARPQEKLDLVRFLPEQETKSYTNIYDALEEALGLLGAGPSARSPAPGLDEVVLLSDGVPNRGKLRDEDRIVEAIAALNAGRVRIHTVSLGPPTTKLLERLAATNGGRSVTEPIAK
jgi:hypothetical protein